MCSVSCSACAIQRNGDARTFLRENRRMERYFSVLKDSSNKSLLLEIKHGTRKLCRLLLRYKMQFSCTIVNTDFYSHRKNINNGVATNEKDSIIRMILIYEKFDFYIFDPQILTQVRASEK